MKKSRGTLLVLLLSFDISYAQCNGDINHAQKHIMKSYLTTHNAFNSDQDDYYFKSNL